jgi:hypothetical protein
MTAVYRPRRTESSPHFSGSHEMTPASQAVSRCLPHCISPGGSAAQEQDNRHISPRLLNLGDSPRTLNSACHPPNGGLRPAGPEEKATMKAPWQPAPGSRVTEPCCYDRIGRGQISASPPGLPRALRQGSPSRIGTPARVACGSWGHRGAGASRASAQEVSQGRALSGRGGDPLESIAGCGRRTGRAKKFAMHNTMTAYPDDGNPPILSAGLLTAKPLSLSTWV